MGCSLCLADKKKFEILLVSQKFLLEENRFRQHGAEIWNRTPGVDKENQTDPVLPRGKRSISENRQGTCAWTLFEALQKRLVAL